MNPIVRSNTKTLTTKRLTAKYVCEQVIASYPLVKELELIRANEGYFYAVGRMVADNKEFITCGIYCYRLNDMTLTEWVEELTDKIQNAVAPWEIK